VVLKDSSNVVILFVVSLVAVVGIAIMLVSTSLNPAISDSSGFAFSTSFPGYANPISSVTVDSNLVFSSASDTASRLVQIWTSMDSF
jgi:hypothetical protein